MGNCIDLEKKKKKAVRITRMDGQMLQYPPPLKVQRVLDEFPGHSISDALPAITYLDPAMFMRQGNQTMETGNAVGVVRVKLVTTKRQLKDMLSKGGMTPDDILSILQRKQSRKRSASSDEERPMEWRPTLESIPERNDFY